MHAALFILFAFLGSPVRWHGPIGIDADKETQRVALQEARQWARAGHIRFERGHGIRIEWAELNPHFYANCVLTLSGNEITGALVTLNSKTVVSKADLQFVLLHELGHAIGIGCSKDRDCVMFCQLSGFAKLQADDKAAVRALYRK